MAKSKNSEVESGKTTSNLGAAGGVAAGAALGSLLGPIGAAVGAVVDGIAGAEGRQSGAGKAQAEAKTCCPRPDEVGGRQIGGQEEAFNEETCGQEVVHEAEVTISSTLIRCPADYRLALTVAIIGTPPPRGRCAFRRGRKLF
jgi:hypothetical protein